MDHIVLRRARNGWTATFEGMEGIEVRRLFGTDTIPTPFTAEADAETVLARVRERNPKSTVLLG